MLRTIWFVVLALVTFAGCGDSKQWKNVKARSGETWDAVTNWGVEKRGQAEAFFSKSVTDLSQRVEAAKAKAQDADGKAATALDSKWQDVSVKLEELKTASADKWEQAREAFVRAYESAKQEVSSEP
jgi:hypothetical protein